MFAALFNLVTLAAYGVTQVSFVDEQGCWISLIWSGLVYVIYSDIESRISNLDEGERLVYSNRMGESD